MIDLKLNQISGNTSISRNRELKASRKTKVSNFEVDLEITKEIEETAHIQSPFELGGVDGLFFALQKQENKTQEAINHGSSILDKLQFLQKGMMEGKISKETLLELSQFSKDNLGFNQDSDLDPKLKDILREINIRTQVELAKLERI